MSQTSNQTSAAPSSTPSPESTLSELIARVSTLRVSRRDSPSPPSEAMSGMNPNTSIHQLGASDAPRIDNTSTNQTASPVGNMPATASRLVGSWSFLVLPFCVVWLVLLLRVGSRDNHVGRVSCFPLASSSHPTDIAVCPHACPVA